MAGMTDACTLWPDTFGRISLTACCAAHDAAYDLGLDKLGADFALFDCVHHVAGWPMALLMLAGVSLGGLPFFLLARRRQSRTKI